MSEIVTSLLNKNTLIYGRASTVKNEGPSCVDGKEKNVDGIQLASAETPIKVVREK